MKCLIISYHLFDNTGGVQSIFSTFFRDDVALTIDITVFRIFGPFGNKLASSWPAKWNHWTLPVPNKTNAANYDFRRHCNQSCCYFENNNEYVIASNVPFKVTHYSMRMLHCAHVFTIRAAIHASKYVYTYVSVYQCKNNISLINSGYRR